MGIYSVGNGFISNEFEFVQSFPKWSASRCSQCAACHFAVGWLLQSMDFDVEYSVLSVLWILHYFHLDRVRVLKFIKSNNL